MTRRILLMLAAVATLGAACEPRSAPDARQGSGLDELFDRERLVIVADDGTEHVFDVWIAAEREQQTRGLMFVREMPESGGMLFVYDRPRVQSMWMKNTYIPLDLLFIRADGSVSSVIHETRPLSLQSQSSVEPVSYVLELNAGVARRLGIGSRSRIVRDAP